MEKYKGFVLFISKWRGIKKLPFKCGMPGLAGKAVLPSHTRIFTGMSKQVFLRVWILH
jgi:hypothetical protein